jgi:hypothetical protein
VTGESWAGVYVAPIAANTGCAADVDGDGVVGAVDLASLLVEWDCAALCTNDLDGDGLVGVLDLNLLLNAWGPCDGGG